MIKRLSMILAASILLIGCNEKVARSGSTSTEKDAHNPAVVKKVNPSQLPHFDERVFKLDSMRDESAIDLTLIDKISATSAEEIAPDYILNLFKPVRGSSTVYNYSVDYYEPINIDGHGGDYSELLTIQVSEKGIIEDAFIFLEGRGVCPRLLELFRLTSNERIKFSELTSISQLRLEGPYENFPGVYSGGRGRLPSAVSVKSTL